MSQLTEQHEEAVAATAAATPEELEQRLLRVGQWLAEGRSRREAVAAAEAEWGIGRRMAQLYVQRVQKRLTLEAAKQDPLYYLRLTQVQRDRLLQIGHQFLAQKDLDPKTAVTLLRSMAGLLDSRDRAVINLRKVPADTERKLRRAEAEKVLAESKLERAKTRTFLAKAPPAKTRPAAPAARKPKKEPTPRCTPNCNPTTK